MPELPEVHTTATMLNRLLKGLRISDVWTNYNSSYHKGKDNIKDPKFFRKFRVKIISAKIKNVERRGKNVLINLDNEQTIIVHMKMTGHLLYGTYRKSKIKNQNEKWQAVKPESLKETKNQWLRFVITFNNGKHLALSDLRRFAKVTAVPTETAHQSQHLADIGPEPLAKSFTYDKFLARILTRPRGKIKQVLMTPSIIAGIGNIYSDEILWASSVHPASVVGKIPEKKLKKIFRFMKLTLKKGIRLSGDSTSDYRTPTGKPGRFQLEHRAYRMTGRLCDRRGCGGNIRRLKLGGRSAHFCDRHQKKF